MTPTVYSQPQASVALRTGTRIEKINAKHGDSRPNGAQGIVTSSVSPQMWHGRMTQAYLVTWDGFSVPAFITGDKVRKLA